MQYNPGLYSVTLGADTPASIAPALQRRAFEAWVATLDPFPLPTDSTGQAVNIRFGDQPYRFVLHGEAGIPTVQEADPWTYVCTFPDGSRIQLFCRLVESAQQPFAPPSSGQQYRLDILSLPMSVAIDQHATLPRYVAFIKGYLDERRDFEVYIQTGSAELREQLIASIATISQVGATPTLDGG